MISPRLPEAQWAGIPGHWLSDGFNSLSDLDQESEGVRCIHGELSRLPAQNVTDEHLSVMVSFEPELEDMTNLHAETHRLLVRQPAGIPLKQRVPRGARFIACAQPSETAAQLRKGLSEAIAHDVGINFPIREVVTAGIATHMCVCIVRQSVNPVKPDCIDRPVIQRENIGVNREIYYE